MHKLVRHTDKFNPDSPADMKRYSEIINDPLCSVIEERKLRKSDKTFNEDGQLESATTIDFMVISWEEKTIL